MERIIHLISPFLNNGELNNCRLNKAFQNAIEKPIIWSILLKRDFPLNNHLDKSKSRYRYLLTNYNHNRASYRTGKYTIKRRKNKALLFSISVEEDSEISILLKTNIVKDNSFFPKHKVEIKKGDIISIYHGRYLTESIYIFNGEVFEELANNIYDLHRAIPKKYCFPEFPLLYWHEIIKYGFYINISDIFFKEIEENVKFVEDKLISHFTYDNTKYSIIGHIMKDSDDSYDNYIYKIKSGLITTKCFHQDVNDGVINLYVGKV
jgi:hypothetical protein